MKESKYSVDNRIVFRETFESEDSVRKNGGTPINVLFSEGVGQFNGSSQIKYPKIISGTYSIRIRFKRVVIETKSIIDFSNHGLSGVGYLYINTGSGILSYSSGTPYVNGIQTNTCTITTKEIILSGLSIISVLTQFSIGARVSAANPINADYELLEIYKGTLTASEVANLYNSSFNMPAVPYSGGIKATTYTSNFSSGVDGWTFNGDGTVSGNESIGEETQVLKYTSGINETYHSITRSTFSTNTKYTLRFKYYIPSSNTMINRIYVCYSASNIISSALTTTNAWTSYEITFSASAASFRFYAGNNGVPNTFIGNANDVFYIKDIVLYELKPQALMLFDATQGGLIDRTKLRTLTATDVVTRREGNSYSAIFNGSTSKILSSDDVIGTKAITFMAWVLPTFITGIGVIMSNKDVFGAPFNFYISNINNRIYLTRNSSTTPLSGNNAWSLGNWNFVCATSKSDGKTTYYVGTKNAAPIQSGSTDGSAGTPLTTGNAINIGYGDSKWFKGSIKLISLYEGILSLQEITQIWQQTRRII